MELELKRMLDINEFIHGNGDPEYAAYHERHIKLAKLYACTLNNSLGFGISNKKLSFIALAHDILKEKGLNPEWNRSWRGIQIPEDTNRYVRTNLDILEEYNGMDEYFNTAVQYHALAAAIFLHKEFGVRDPEIIYPVMFHSCPILPVYEQLPKKIRHMVDIIVLSDKLSANRIRIEKGKPVRGDLDLAVFGHNGKSLNYDIGLYMARWIKLDIDGTEYENMINEYYLNRAKSIMPITFKKPGDPKVIPFRESNIVKGVK